MTAAIQKRNSLILLDESTSEEVLVVTRDDDRFVTTAKDAARACQAYDDQLAFGRQFEELLERLAHWVQVRTSAISSAFITVRTTDILFVVVQKQVAYDAELVDQLTDIDISVANAEEFSLIEMNVVSMPAVPQEAATAFLASGHIYTHSSSDAQQNSPPTGSEKEC